jgi:hypothetical protein
MVATENPENRLTEYRVLENSRLTAVALDGGKSE